MRPRYVDEEVQERVDARRAHHVRDEVEVVVVHHHDRPRRATGHRFGDRVGETPVHLDVPVVPGVDVGARDVRRRAVVPEVVLDEPQQRIGDHGIEVVVNAGFDRQHPHAARVVVGAGRARVGGFQIERARGPRGGPRRWPRRRSTSSSRHGERGRVAPSRDHRRRGAREGRGPRPAPRRRRFRSAPVPGAKRARAHRASRPGRHRGLIRRRRRPVRPRWGEQALLLPRCSCTHGEFARHRGLRHQSATTGPRR